MIPSPARVAARFRAASRPKRPKMRVGETYTVSTGGKEIGTVGLMTEDEVMMDIAGRPYKIISLSAFNAWIAKMPQDTSWAPR